MVLEMEPLPPCPKQRGLYSSIRFYNLPVVSSTLVASSMHCILGEVNYDKLFSFLNSSVEFM